jgi:hypothetical protein
MQAACHCNKAHLEVHSHPCSLLLVSPTSLSPRCSCRESLGLSNRRPSAPVSTPTTASSGNLAGASLNLLPAKPGPISHQLSCAASAPGRITSRNTVAVPGCSAVWATNLQGKTVPGPVAADREAPLAHSMGCSLQHQAQPPVTGSHDASVCSQLLSACSRKVPCHHTGPHLSSIRLLNSRAPWTWLLKAVLLCRNPIKSSC